METSHTETKEQQQQQQKQQQKSGLAASSREAIDCKTSVLHLLELRECLTPAYVVPS